MNLLVIELGSALAAGTLIGYAILSFFTGAAYLNGATVREAMVPALTSYRQSSGRGRSDLADGSLLLAVALAVASVPVDRAVAGGVLACGLMCARNTVRRMTSSEHPLMALGSQFGADLAIGVVAPIAIAHALLGSWMLSAAHLCLCVSLSWPAGGPGRSDGGWKPSWVLA